MSALDKIPNNINFLSPLGFHFHVKKIPHVNFFLQHVNIPSITLPTAKQATPFVDIPHPGDHCIFEPLSIRFKIDEDMNNYNELLSWVTALGFPDEHSQYAEIASKNQSVGDGIVSDISLIILTSLKNANIEITFRDAWPTYLGNFALNTVDNSVQYIDCAASFNYTSFKLATIPK